MLLYFASRHIARCSAEFRSYRSVQEQLVVPVSVMAADHRAVDDVQSTGRRVVAVGAGVLL
jgi:hypothetical protein